MNTEFREKHDVDQDTFIACFADTDYFDDEQDAREYLADIDDPKRRLFVLIIDSQWCGFFTYYHQYSHYANYLEDFFVLKQHRRKGYGRMILEEYIRRSRADQTRNAFALSSTHMDNITSQRVHESFGFERLGVLKELHYGTDEIFYGYRL